MSVPNQIPKTTTWPIRNSCSQVILRGDARRRPDRSGRTAHPSAISSTDQTRLEPARGTRSTPRRRDALARLARQAVTVGVQARLVGGIGPHDGAATVGLGLGAARVPGVRACAAELPTPMARRVRCEHLRLQVRRRGDACRSTTAIAATWFIADPVGVQRVMSTDGELARTSTWLTPSWISRPGRRGRGEAGTASRGCGRCRWPGSRRRWARRSPGRCRAHHRRPPAVAAKFTVPAGSVIGPFAGPGIEPDQTRHRSADADLVGSGDRDGDVRRRQRVLVELGAARVEDVAGERGGRRGPDRDRGTLRSGRRRDASAGSWAAADGGRRRRGRRRSTVVVGAVVGGGAVTGTVEVVVVRRRRGRGGGLARDGARRGGRGRGGRGRPATMRGADRRRVAAPATGSHSKPVEPWTMRMRLAVRHDLPAGGGGRASRS